MNDLIEKVKQGLRCHSKSGKCSGNKNSCPYWDVFCIPATCTDALSVIESLQSEIKILSENCDGLAKQRDDFATVIHEQKMEIERLRQLNRW